MIGTSSINSLVIPYFYTPHSSWIVGWSFREGILSIWTAKQNMLRYRFVGSNVCDAINLVTRLLKNQSPGKVYNDYVKNNRDRWQRIAKSDAPYYSIGPRDDRKPARVGSFTGQPLACEQTWIKVEPLTAHVRRTDLPVTDGPKAYSSKVNDDNVRMIGSLRFDMSELRNRVALLEQDKERQWAAIRDALDSTQARS